LERVGLDEWVKETHRGLETDLLADGAPLSRTQALALTIARAIAGGPSVLILDRTLDQVSPAERVEIFEAVTSKRDMSVLLISNEPELVERADHRFELTGELHLHGEAA
jgi:ABC-type multidrug transport system fused ATPase/permease subunit